MDKKIDILRDISAEVLGHHAKLNRVDWSEIAAKTECRDFICATIPMAGEKLELTFNTYFRFNEAKSFVESRHDKDFINSDFIVDFFREYCNLIYGEYKRTFDDIGHPLDQTLPESFIEENFQFSRDDNESSHREEYWELVSDKGRIYVGIEFDFDTKEGIAQLAKPKKEMEIEFL